MGVTILVGLIYLYCLLWALAVQLAAAVAVFGGEQICAIFSHMVSW